MTTKYVSPKGAAGYPKLTRPDTKFKAEGEYSTALTLDEKDGKAFLETLKQACIDEVGNKAAQTAKYPCKIEEGKYTFKFKSKNKPKLYDSKGKPITAEDLNIGSGSVLKVAGSMSFPKVQGVQYVSLYMNQVQIINLVEYSSSPFGEEEGGFTAEDSSFAESSTADEENVEF
jgi:hypothetical protein